MIPLDSISRNRRSLRVVLVAVIGAAVILYSTKEYMLSKVCSVPVSDSLHLIPMCNPKAL